LAAAVGALVAAVSTAGALAQEAAGAGGVRLGVVDLVVIRREADGARTIASQLETFVVGYQTDIEKEEAELRAAQEQLTAKRSSLSAEEYADERRKWEQAVAEAQRRFLRRRQEIDQARASAWQRLNGALDQAIRDVAAERGLTIVVRRDQIVFAAPGLEITEAVLARLNQSLPSISFGGDG
jgi:outer membrane protein